MVKYIKKCEQGMMLSTIATLLLGIILIIEPTSSIRVITAIIGLIILVIGAVQIFEYLRMPKKEKYTSFSLVIGVVCASIGIFLFLNTQALIQFATIIIGLSICIKSLFKLQFALNLKGISDKWNYNLLVGLLTLLVGLLLLINPFESAVIFLRIIGVILVIGSILELIETGMVIKTLDDVVDLPFVEKEKTNKDDKDIKKDIKEEKKKD